MTGVLVAVAVALAGGLGAATRFVVDGALRARLSVATTLAVNVTGSLALGLLAGLTLRHGLAGPWAAVLGTGFLGGYTTFSTASTETVRLLQAGRYAAAVLTSVGTLVLSVAACAAGLALAGLPGPP
ncbi:CrcB family protein [Cellulomonas sp. ATA003]|uniref:fluoride efflux transporter FluC n=1 Tax=Cellulomonas sp. ATA003 TaxID=3073064 RepID=UPI002872D11E|nr:CrcB family protein [Cellulomonas sp. ATA003]WNB85823.1 CrcB family protein [Cellulomonas sp. ATA003]